MFNTIAWLSSPSHLAPPPPPFSCLFPLQFCPLPWTLPSPSPDSSFCWARKTAKIEWPCAWCQRLCVKAGIVSAAQRSAAGQSRLQNRVLIITVEQAKYSLLWSTGLSNREDCVHVDIHVSWPFFYTADNPQRMVCLWFYILLNKCGLCL